MNHFKLIVFCVFALALSAGLVAGKLDWGAGASAAKSEPTSAFAAELGLNDTQCQQIRGIWEPLRQSAKSSFDQARRLERQRDDAFFSLLTEEQKKEYGKIKHDYEDRMLALRAKRDAEFREAVDKTRQLLTAPQREKYEALIKDRLNARERPEKPASGMAAVHPTPDFTRPND